MKLINQLPKLIGTQVFPAGHEVGQENGLTTRGIAQGDGGLHSEGYRIAGQQTGKGDVKHHLAQVYQDYSLSTLAAKDAALEHVLTGVKPFVEAAFDHKQAGGAFLSVDIDFEQVLECHERFSCR